MQMCVGSSLTFYKKWGGKMYRYIQLRKESDGYGYMVADSKLSSTVQAEDMILVDISFSVEGKRYNYDTKDWEICILPEPEPTPLTEQEEISIDTALNVEYMVCLMEESLGLE